MIFSLLLSLDFTYVILLITLAEECFSVMTFTRLSMGFSLVNKGMELKVVHIEIICVTILNIYSFCKGQLYRGIAYLSHFFLSWFVER